MKLNYVIHICMKKAQDSNLLDTYFFSEKGLRILQDSRLQTKFATEKEAETVCKKARLHYEDILDRDTYAGCSIVQYAG